MDTKDSNPPAALANTDGPDARELVISIRRDQAVVREAEAGMQRALRCLEAGLDDIFLHELQLVIRAYVDSERGRLFAIAAERESEKDRQEGVAC